MKISSTCLQQSDSQAIINQILFHHNKIRNRTILHSFYEEQIPKLPREHSREIIHSDVPTQSKFNSIVLKKIITKDLQKINWRKEETNA